MIDRIQWFGNGSFLIKGPPLIYINPWRVARGTFHADIILISHDNYDFCSIADIEKLRGPDTIILGNEAVQAHIPDCKVLRPWQSITVDQVSIKALPAYSVDSLRYPKEAGGLGFVISMNFYDIYYAGNTELIPEMEMIRPDVAILPICGHGSLSVTTAVQAAERLQPRWVIPCQWGEVGENATRLDAQALKSQVGAQAEVIILEN